MANEDKFAEKHIRWRRYEGYSRIWAYGRLKWANEALDHIVKALELWGIDPEELSDQLYNLLF